MSETMPIKLAPAFKEYLWGGSKLKSLYNKKCETEICAESWELSAHKDGQSKICGGVYDGATLSEYLERTGKGVLGTNAEKFDYFPILIKLIDAKDNLSVQVHPDDKYALEKKGEYGKTEMWYILDCEEGASLYYGFSKDITGQEYESAIKTNTLTELLNKVPVHKGDVFFIPAGTVHAIGAGIVICEIQQNSNTTYRVYDYGRRDKDGNTRPLHIEKALEVSDLKKTSGKYKAPEGDCVILAECEYFTVHRLKVTEKTERKIDNSSFHSLIVTDGEGMLNMDNAAMELKKGDSVFIPAQNASYTITGACEVIVTNI